MTELAEYRKQLYIKPDLRMLFFELTDCCNLACGHCGSSCSPQNATFLPKEAIFRTLESVKRRYGTEPLICLTGGEPLMYKDFFEVAKHINNVGFKWGITTNAMLIDEYVASKLAEYGMVSVSISLDGDKDCHNMLRGRNDAYDKCLEGICHVVKNCPNTVTMVTTVVTKENIKQLDKIYNIVSSLGVDSWRLVNIDPIGRAKHSGLLLDSSEMIYLIDYIRSKRFDPSVKLDVTYGCSHYLTESYEHDIRDTYFLCYAGIAIASVLCNGDIFACLDIERLPELVQGNIYKDDFAKVWENGFKIFRQERSQFNEECLKCSDGQFCAGDSAHTWDFKNNKPDICIKKIIQNR